MRRIALPLLILSGLSLGLLGLRGAAVGLEGRAQAAEFFRSWGGGILSSSLLCAAAAWLLYLRKDGVAFLGRKKGKMGTLPEKDAEEETSSPEKRAAFASIRDFALSALCLFLLSLLAQYAIPSLLG